MADLAAAPAASDADLIERSLDLAAGCGEDITEPVFDHFFALAPAARAYFHLDDIDPRAHGRMLSEVLTLLLDGARGETYVPPTLRTQFVDHQSYGVIDRTLYVRFLEALTAVVSQRAGDGWSRDMQAAWERQAERLIDAGFAPRTPPSSVTPATTG